MDEERITRVKYERDFDSVRQFCCSVKGEELEVSIEHLISEKGIPIEVLYKAAQNPKQWFALSRREDGQIVIPRIKLPTVPDYENRAKKIRFSGASNRDFDIMQKGLFFDENDKQNESMLSEGSLDCLIESYGISPKIISDSVMSRGSWVNVRYDLNVTRDELVKLFASREKVIPIAVEYKKDKSVCFVMGFVYDLNDKKLAIGPDFGRNVSPVVVDLGDITDYELFPNMR